MPQMRPAAADRTYVAPSIDSAIASLVPRFKDFNLGTLFENCLPNSLDTIIMVSFGDTFVVTGDIEAMWLRDSSNQVMPYLPYAKGDAALTSLLTGLIQRQARSVLIDPYANAFQLNAYQGQGPHADDATYKTLYAGTVVSAMTPSVFERKWEVDSLANVLHLSAAYWSASGDASPFNATWVAAVSTILATFADQQLDTAQEDASPTGPAYTFQRTTSQPSDTLESGRGYPVKYTGMIKTGFRASDDAAVYSFNIPENAFAAVALRGIVPLLTALGQSALANQASAIASDVEAGIAAHGTMLHPTAGRVYAYEVDGFGNAIFMDDANVPSLLSLPLLGFTNASDPVYAATRAAVLSPANPWYFNGTAAAGIGGPHNGVGWVWPLSLMVQAWTSSSDAEIAGLLSTLTASSACTGLMHESFNLNDFTTYTRPWFAWANSFFGALILKIASERPYLILN